MPAASRHRLEKLHVLLVEDSLQYLRTTPPARRRASRLLVIRQLLADSEVGLRRAYSRRLRKTLDDLREAYAKQLLAQLQAGDVRPGIFAEARIYLRAQERDAEYQAEQRQAELQRDTSKSTKGATTSAPAVVLPFTADGSRRADH